MTPYTIRSLVDITPILDVMFMLLIITMVILPLSSGETFAQPPLAANLSLRAGLPSDHVLSIEPEGAFILDRHVVADADLSARIRAMYEHSSNPMLYLSADRGLDYARVLDAVAIARQNGVRVVAMIAEPPPVAHTP